MKINKKLRTLIQSVCIIFLFLAFTAGYILSSKPDNSSELEFTQDPVENTINRNLIYLYGAIKNEGAYDFSTDDTLQSIIDRAGGFSEDADVAYINANYNLLSDKPHDEEVITIPSLNDAAIAQENADKISINNASIEDLESLPGIGEATAQKIIDGRPFSNIEELLDISGIGDKKYAQIVNLISL